MIDLSLILRPMLFSTKEQAYIPCIPSFANAHSLEVLIQTSREILLLVFGVLCSCARAAS